VSRIVLGSRGSALALAQTRWVAGRLQEAHPGLEVTVEILSTAGDRIQDRPLPAIGGKGLFTRELEEALLDGRIDGAVHSLKDLPTEMTPGLTLGAVPARENPADVLVSRHGGTLAELPPGAVVGTSSPRRRAQLARLRPDLRFTDLRGNVPTRLRKVREGAVDATVLAAAGLARLGLLEEADGWPLPSSLMLPAPGQGALALQIRDGDAQMADLAGVLHDPDTARTVAAERAVLAALGTGCSAPVGALARIQGETLVLDACFGGEDDRPQVRRRLASPAAPEALGQDMAARLLEARTCPGPLAGKRIVVTRAEEQAGKLHALLEERGAEVLDLPVLTVVPEEDTPAPGPAGDYDWVLFTSMNAVRMFARLLERHGRGLAEFAVCRIATVGPATADALREYGLSPALIPPEAVGESLLTALQECTGSVAGLSILLPQGNLARPIIRDTLAAQGAKVHALVTYRTEAVLATEEQLQTFANFRPDAVAFASPSAVRNFFAITDSNRSLQINNDPCRFVSIGPVTSKALEELGKPVAQEAEEHTLGGLVVAVERALGVRT